MNPLLEEARRRILDAPDTVCLERARLVTEAYQEYETGPAVLRRAKALARVLRNMTLDLDTNPVFAGNVSRGPRAWPLFPEYGFNIPSQAIIEDPSLEGHLDGDAVPQDLREFWKEKALSAGAAGVGHLAPDHELVLCRGLEHVIRQAEHGLSDPDPRKAAFREACVIACRAVIGWAGRFAEAAEEAAMATSEGLRSEALERVAEACRRVPAKPARNLFEALQSIVLVHLAIHVEGHGYSVCPGRMDQLLVPYLDGDDDAVDLLAAFWLKLSENSVWGSHSKTQCITVGGVDADGRDRCNALTEKFLEAAEMVRMPDPHIFVRWHRNISPIIKRRALDMLANGFSMPMVIGDVETATGLMNAGVSEEDAWNYCVIGCNELGVPGKLIFDALDLNDAALVHEAVADAQDIDDVGGMDGVMERLEATLCHRLEEGLGHKKAFYQRQAETVPTPFTSSVMDGCIERGRDMHEELTYPLWTLSERGFSNLVNSLAATETVVFEQRKASMPELRDALKSDFDGKEDLREALVAAAKWGNDDDRADKWAAAWLEMREKVRRSVTDELRVPGQVVCHVIRSLHYVDGKRAGATPDGRRSGEPLCDSIGAVLGTQKEGPTALLNSVRKIRPSEFWTGGYNLNLTLPATQQWDEEMVGKLVSMADVFFAEGGQELQIGALDAGALRDAQEHPERHPDLMVRIAGFNALFVKLSRMEQDELVRRAELAR